MRLPQRLAGCLLAGSIAAGCTSAAAPPCPRPPSGEPCPPAVRCPTSPPERRAEPRPATPDPWLAVKALGSVPYDLRTPAYLSPLRPGTKAPAAKRTRTVDFEADTVSGARPDPRPASTEPPTVRTVVAEALIQGRHEIALQKLLDWAEGVATGKQPHPADAFLAAVRADLLALAQETHELATQTKSRRFLALGLAAYQLLARLPRPAAGEGATDGWLQHLSEALDTALMNEVRAVTWPPPPPPRRPEPGQRQIMVGPRTLRPTFHGTLVAKHIRRVVRRRLPEVVRCHEVALGRGKAAGEVVLRLVVDGWGRVAQATVTRNATNDAALARCLEEAAGGWIFPEVDPPTATTVITYPLNLVPTP